MGQRDLVDRILSGQLEAKLRELRSEGKTFDVIARWLEDEHQIPVSRETLRRWAIEYGIENPEAAAS